MDRLATFAEPSPNDPSVPIFLDCDLNIRLDRPSDPYAATLVDGLASYGCTDRVTSATPVCGGMLDVVVTRDDLPAPSVDVTDVDLSNHRLLSWQACTIGPSVSVLLDSDKLAVESARPGRVSC